MSSSGLIYAVIVGAWAAYLVPMWLRRQDELNEARPTERFSTAIRLLSGRAAMERRISRQLDETQPLGLPTPLPKPSTDTHGVSASRAFDPDEPESVGHPEGGEDLGGNFAPPAQAARSQHRAAAAAHSAHPVQGGPSPDAASRRRAALLARRRRMVVVLFAAFTVGMVVAAVGGVDLLWIPAVPAVLFSLYIGQMRRQEHRRYEVRLDRRRAVEAAQRVRQQAAARREAETAAAAPVPREAAAPHLAARTPRATEETDHGVGATTSGTGSLGAGRGEPWADHDRPEHAAAASAARDDGGWDPVPVPLPTYVTAPVAPRATLGLDLSAPDTYSSARGRKAPAAGQAPAAAPAAKPAQTAPGPATPPRRPAPKPATPLFDQFADDTPRAANE
ncbi:hypothetical protein [Streptacidiphilus jiangxiensis]|uniref:Uncharacterized protein n=1 Tax=Streptacidiphilus jiangxiensis TaxID=235985 RepID=A0A1H7FA51_STRJI|nr:hypothetical protein [Streptacidiphilus jiangxiensis]SEK22976.1 hypothetical protein SAMN05414137_101166 [Streptacidiphilus jiangxiensis]